MLCFLLWLRSAVWLMPVAAATRRKRKLWAGAKLANHGAVQQLAEGLDHAVLVMQRGPACPCTMARKAWASQYEG